MKDSDKWNAVCPGCSVRYVDKSKPMDWIHVERCKECKKQKLTTDGKWKKSKSIK